MYIDPPYNSRQYCDAYHLLENVARWEKPEVYGVAKKMKRDSVKSRYCTKSAPAAFEDLIKNIRAKYILLSYNNMAEKGSVKVFSESYKAFSTGKSNISDNAERLFLCTCFGEDKV